MNLRLLKYFFTLNFLFFSFTITAQISQKGVPIFLYSKQKSTLEVIDLPPFAPIYRVLKHQEQKANIQTKAMQYAYKYQVRYNTTNSGVWQSLPDGRRVWRLALQSKGAYSLGLLFSKYKLPKNAQLFIYNADTNNYLGAFTAANNKEWGGLAIQAFAGDKLIVEYIEPAKVDFAVDLEIGGVLHDYKNVFRYLKGIKSDGLGDAGKCNVDINCDAGANWQEEKRAVCKITSNGFLGTGTLMNNNNFDAKPYLLTAHHVIATKTKANAAVFYFNYENSACKKYDAKDNQTISGASLKATTKHLDFALLEISSDVPKEYNPYYAGWDCSGRIAKSTITIHHPQGDAKKISVDNDSPETGTYIDSEYTFDKDSHWKILRWDIGTTEGGSSGAPLFDENHRVIGDLTGGDATCNNPINDYYAKLSVSWDKYSEKDKQLKYWLNPKNNDSKILNGFDPQIELYADFKLSDELVCENVPVSIVDASTGDASLYIWNFGENAIPSKSTEKIPPNIKYTKSGQKIITLTVEKKGKQSKVSKRLNVVGKPIVNFEYVLQENNEVNFIGKSKSAQYYLWSFGDGQQSANSTVVHKYNKLGNYKVTLKADNNCGSSYLTKEIVLSFDKALVVYPNPSDGAFTVDLTRIKNEKILWEIYNVAGMKVKEGVKAYAKQLRLNLSNLQSGIYLLKVTVNGEVLKRKLILL